MGKRITELPVAAAVTTDDLVVIVDNPGGTPETKRATVAQIVALAGATPGGGTGAVQYNNAGALGGIAPNAAFGKPLVSNGLAVPPIYDSISLANNAAVVAPGAANEVLISDGTGAVSAASGVKAGAGYWSVGTNPAASGGGRLANNVAWKARNAANSADRQLCVLNGSDVAVFGDTNIAMTLDASSSGVSVPTCLKVGSGTFATVGGLRYPHGDLTLVATRNAIDTDDCFILHRTSGNILYIGTDSAFTSAKQVNQLFINTSGGLVAVGVGGTSYVVLENSLIENNKPRVGYSTPYASEGRATQAMADANQTLAADKYSRKLLKFTGANTAARTATLPHPASEDASYVKHVENACTGSDLVISTGTGTTVTMTAGQLRLLDFSPSGVKAANV